MKEHKAWRNRVPVQNRILQTVPCAVLLPIVEKEGQEQLLFEVRSPKLGWQPGDICFPGGSIEAEDTTPWVTAQRETEEELGIDRANIELLGPLDYVESPVGVLVYPYAAYVQYTDLCLNTKEVAKVFTVPLQWFETHQAERALMDIATKPAPGFPADVSVASQRDWMRRRPYEVLVYRYEKYIIWGITAQIIRNFLSLRRTMTKEYRAGEI